MILHNKNESFSDALLRWTNSFEENLELDDKDEKTIENYINVVNKFSEYIISDENLERLSFKDIDVKFIKKYFLFRDNGHQIKTGNKLKPSTKRNDKKILAIFFEYIEDENKDNFQFFIKWKKISFKKESVEKEHYAPEIVAEILEYLEQKIRKDRDDFSYMLSFCFKLALFGGLRASEICSIKLNQFGKVYNSKDGNSKLIPLIIYGKGNTKFTNPIPYSYIKNEFNYFKRKGIENEIIFHSQTGLKLNRQHLYRYFENISKDIQVYKAMHRTFSMSVMHLIYKAE